MQKKKKLHIPERLIEKIKNAVSTLTKFLKSIKEHV